ncbi:uncharacterized protein LOC127278629 [Leptopilina boulardi]|uniref:uncharacterized protein LOC127278629 n=1 Tax=Leptopilina boulardi TaxID=63433 RepID=UPI0021F69480|nr:uncharacterized protein LOC127278629 [Leptopilina boulardi]
MEVTSPEGISCQNLVISQESAADVLHEFEFMDTNAPSTSQGSSMKSGTIRKPESLNNNAKRSKTQATQEIPMKALMPISFRSDIQQGLDNNYLLPSQENAIIRIACNNMKSRNRTSPSDINQMATLLLQEYPILCSSSSVGNSLVNS